MRARPPLTSSWRITRAQRKKREHEHKGINQIQPLGSSYVSSFSSSERACSKSLVLDPEYQNSNGDHIIGKSRSIDPVFSVQ